MVSVYKTEMCSSILKQQQQEQQQRQQRQEQRQEQQYSKSHRFFTFVSEPGLP